MLKLILLLLVTYVTALSLVNQPSDQQAVQIFDYGRYCGLWHSASLDVIPKDRVDRICQVHDICVSAWGILDCFCSEQALFLFMQYSPKTTAQATARDSYISKFYKAEMPCSTNYLELDSHFQVPARTVEGYSFLPFYYWDSLDLAQASVEVYAGADLTVDFGLSVKVKFLEPKIGDHLVRPEFFYRTFNSSLAIKAELANLDATTWHQVYQEANIRLSPEEPVLLLANPYLNRALNFEVKPMLTVK